MGWTPGVGTWLPERGEFEFPQHPQVCSASCSGLGSHLLSTRVHMVLTFPVPFMPGSHVPGVAIRDPTCSPFLTHPWGAGLQEPTVWASWGRLGAPGGEEGQWVTWPLVRNELMRRGAVAVTGRSVPPTPCCWRDGQVEDGRLFILVKSVIYPSLKSDSWFPCPSALPFLNLSCTEILELLPTARKWGLEDLVSCIFGVKGGKLVAEFCRNPCGDQNSLLGLSELTTQS